MATLKYYSEFDSFRKTWVDGQEMPVQLRFELWDMEAVDGAYEPEHIYMSGSEPFVLHWEPAEKFQPIIGSQATFTLMSEENFQFAELFTDNPQRYKIVFYDITGGMSMLIWTGWLNTETYREHLADNAGNGYVYPVDFIASDLGVLKRMKFLDVENGGGHYTGMRTYRWYLNLILRDKLGLTAWDPLVEISTQFMYMPAAEYFDHIFVDAGNWYDEDGEAMSLWEVLEELVRPFGAFVYGYADAPGMRWLPRITDYNTILGNMNNRLEDLVHGYASTEGEFGISPMYNGLTITSSRYASNELQKWEAKLEDLTGLIDEETCYPYPGATGIDPKQALMTLRRYSGCKGFNVRAQLPLEYWYLKELDSRLDSKEEVWLCVTHGRGDMFWWQYPRLVFEDKDTILYPSNAAKLNLNMKIKVAQRDTRSYPLGTLPHLTYEGVNNNQSKMYSVDLRGRLECIGQDGEVKCHMRYAYSGGRQVIEWLDGPDLLNLGKFVCAAYNGNEGLHNSSWSIGPILENVRLEEPAEGIFNLPLPPATGYLRWTIELVNIHGISPLGEHEGDLWGMLINNVEITTTDASNKYELSTDDKVYTGVINKNAERAMESVTVKVCNSYEKGMAPGKGDLFTDLFGGFKEGLRPIPAQPENGLFMRDVYEQYVTRSHLERLLLRSYHANYTGLFRYYQTDHKNVYPLMGWMGRYGRYTQGADAGKRILPSRAAGDEDGYYLVHGQKIYFREGYTTLHLIEIASDTEVKLPPAKDTEEAGGSMWALPEHQEGLPEAQDGETAPGAPVQTLTVGEQLIASLARNREGYAQASGGGTGAMIIQPAPAAPSYWTPIVDDAYETLYIETGNNVHVAGEGAFVEIEDKIIRSIKEGETAQLQFTREVEEGEREPLPWLACGDVQLAGGVVRRTAVNGEAFIQGERPVLGFVKDPMTSLPAGTEVKAGIRLNAGSEKALDVIGEKVLPAEHQKAVLGEKEKQWKEVWTKGGYVETELLPAETDTAVLGSDAKRWKQAVVKELKAETITTPVATADKKGVVSIVVSGTGNTVTEAKLGDGVLTLTKSNTVVNVTSSGSGPVIVGYSYSNGTLTLRYGTLTCSQAGCYSSCNSCCSCPSCDSCCACSDIYNVCVRCGCNNGDEECKEKKASGECEAEKVEKKATAEAAAAKEKAYHDARQCKGHPEHQQHVEEINSKPLPQVKKNPAKSKKGCPDAGGDANILFQVMQKEVAALRDMVREQGQRILGLERQNAVLREQVEKELESK